MARDTPDAARWLALAAAELLRTTGRAPGPRAAEPGGRAHEAGTWLRAGLCTSYGDEPRTLRLGGVLALDVRLSQNLTFSGGLALTAADRELTDVVSVRVASLSTSLALLYLVRHGRLRYGPGVGVRAGATRLAARGPEEQLELHRLWRGFAGPLAGLRAAFSVHPRVALELDLESAYVLPSIEGRDGDGAALYRQTSWSVAASLGVAVAL